jgi:hypothetical protein
MPTQVEEDQEDQTMPNETRKKGACMVAPARIRKYTRYCNIGEVGFDSNMNRVSPTTGDSAFTYKKVPPMEFILPANLINVLTHDPCFTHTMLVLRGMGLSIPQGKPIMEAFPDAFMAAVKGGRFIHIHEYSWCRVNNFPPTVGMMSRNTVQARATNRAGAPTNPDAFRVVARAIETGIVSASRTAEFSGYVEIPDDTMRECLASHRPDSFLYDWLHDNFTDLVEPQYGETECESLSDCENTELENQEIINSMGEIRDFIQNYQQRHTQPATQP